MPSEVNTPSDRAGDLRLYLRDQELDRGASLILSGERVLTAAAEAARQNAGLSRSQLQMLLSIRQHPGQDVSTLRQRLNLTVPTCARLLGELDREDLIARQRGGGDKRRRMLTLSPKGEAVLGPIMDQIRAALRQAYRSAGPEAVEGARTLLEALAR
ncbi:MAG: MarR family transcriptional regulator [Pseudomonadota bacterium]